LASAKTKLPDPAGPELLPALDRRVRSPSRDHRTDERATERRRAADERGGGTDPVDAEEREREGDPGHEQRGTRDRGDARRALQPGAVDATPRMVFLTQLLDLVIEGRGRGPRA
jgi:hypothetical protein